MNKNKAFIIAALVLVAALIGLAYIYFFMVPKAGKGGLVSGGNKKVGSIQSLFSFYGPGRGDNPRLVKPMSVATDKEGNMYITDTGNYRVVVANKNGEFLFEFGERGIAHPDPGVKATWEPGYFNIPYGIDIDQSTGNIFVADLANKRIQIFDKSGDFIDWFPKQLFGPHNNDITPTAIAVRNGKVYVCNPFQVVIFDTKGNYVGEFGMPGPEPGQFDRPNGIDVAPDGTIYVSDSNATRIQALTPEGKPKWVFGKKGDISTNQDREFGLPRNLRVGPDNNIYVVDAFDFNINVISPEGKKLAEMGKRGVDEGTFNFPNGITVRDDKVLYVVDKENNRVQAVRLTDFVIEDSEESDEE